MGKFSGVLLASDFDNTLIYTEASLRAGKPVPPLSEKNRAAIVRFMEEGGTFVVATGRALATFAPMAPLVPFNAPCIVCNGAAIYDWEKKEYLDFAMLEGVVSAPLDDENMGSCDLLLVGLPPEATIAWI